MSIFKEIELNLLKMLHDQPQKHKSSHSVFSLSKPQHVTDKDMVWWPDEMKGYLFLPKSTHMLRCLEDTC